MEYFWQSGIIIKWLKEYTQSLRFYRFFNRNKITTCSSLVCIDFLQGMWVQESAKKISRKEVLRGQRTTANKHLCRPLRIERKDILVSRVCRVGCVQTSPISFNLRIPFSTCNKGIGTLRSDNGNANENVTEKLTSRSLKLFRPYTKSPIYFKIRKLGWNWREGTASEFRESKIYHLAVPFIQSTQNLVISRRSCCRDGREMYKKACRVVFFFFPFPSPSPS